MSEIDPAQRLNRLDLLAVIDIGLHLYAQQLGYYQGHCITAGMEQDGSSITIRTGRPSCMKARLWKLHIGSIEEVTNG